MIADSLIPLSRRWTDAPPFNNAVNTVITSIGLACIASAFLVILSSLIKDRHNLMDQDNGIAGLICCYPFRLLDRRRRRKEADWDQRFGYLAHGEEPPLLLGAGTTRAGSERVERDNEQGLGNATDEHWKRLLRGDGTRMASIDITRI